LSSCNEEWRTLKFFRLAGYERLARLRERGWHVVDKAFWDGDAARDFEHVYASFNRPLSLMWARFDVPVKLVDEERGDWPEGIPWTWVLTPERLPEQVLFDYELEWAWSPVHSKKEIAHG
jgi:hypothetical protein